MSSQIKTFLLLLMLTTLIIVIGGALGGQQGVIIATGIALVMNAYSYWFSDKIVLRMYKAQPLDASESPLIHTMVAELATNAKIPKPRIYVVPEASPNAFATGRNPANGVVAVTSGLLKLLSPDELRGVLAHEIAHIAHRDTLIQTVASVISTAIVFLANMAKFGAIFGGGGNNNSEGGSNNNALVMLILAILAPIAASIIQMAISRSREYMADASGSEYARSSAGLASALQKLETYSQQIPMQQATPSTENMFIISPAFSLGGVTANLFRTHPSTADRVARLKEIAQKSSQTFL